MLTNYYLNGDNKLNLVKIVIISDIPSGINISK